METDSLPDSSVDDNNKSIEEKCDHLKTLDQQMEHINNKIQDTERHFSKTTQNERELEEAIRKYQVSFERNVFAIVIFRMKSKPIDSKLPSLSKNATKLLQV